MNFGVLRTTNDRMAILTDEHCKIFYQTHQPQSIPVSLRYLCLKSALSPWWALPMQNRMVKLTLGLLKTNIFVSRHDIGSILYLGWFLIKQNHCNKLPENQGGCTDIQTEQLDCGYKHARRPNALRWPEGRRCVSEKRGAKDKAAWTNWRYNNLKI